MLVPQALRADTLQCRRLRYLRRSWLTGPTAFCGAVKNPDFGAVVIGVNGFCCCDVKHLEKQQIIGKKTVPCRSCIANGDPPAMMKHNCVNLHHSVTLKVL